MSKFYTNVTVMGDNILVKEVENGKRRHYKVKYNPTLFVRSEDETDSPWHTLTGEQVNPIKFGTIKETKEFISNNEGNLDFEIYGNTMFQYAFIAETYPEHEIPYEMGYISIVTVDIETEIEHGFPNIETASERINVITIKDFRNDLYHVFTFKDGKVYNGKNYYNSNGAKNVKHYSYDSEEEMLLGFLGVWRKLDPDVITGWNVRFFDIPYIYNRIEKLFDKKTASKLSPWDIVHSETVTVQQRDHNCYNIFGISTLDYLQIYKKNVLEPRDNYTLGYISSVELKETKVDWHDKYETMKEFYRNDFQLFVEYNIQDVHLPDRLEAKLNLIQLVLDVAYIAKVNYVDVMAQVRTWDTLIFNWLLEENIVIPQKQHLEKKEQFTGAYVMDPRPGMYKHVVSFDVAGLYPAIIQALNIGPETKRSKIKMNQMDVLKATQLWFNTMEQAKSNKTSLASNGVMYDKSVQSFFSRMVAKLKANRKLYQTEVKNAKRELETCTDSIRIDELKYHAAKFDVKQKSTKVMMNSLYGAFGNEFFRFFDIDNAEAVTMTGQVIIQYIKDGMNAFIRNIFKDSTDTKYVIYCDTDSVYITLERLVDMAFAGKNPDQNKITNFLDKVCKEKLEPEINRLFVELNRKMINGMVSETPILSMKREVIASRGLWSSKKHYILSVQDTEGFRHDPPKLKIMGFDMIKSSMPKFCRDSMKEAVKVLLNGDQDEFAEYVEKTRLKFMELPAHDISKNTGLHELDKYKKENDSDDFLGGTPLHIKAVMLYNETIRAKGLQTKYPYITESDKVKLLYLKTPNQLHHKAIAFPATLPAEFDVQKYIDYTGMFDLVFLSPLKKITDPIGWNTDKTFDMDQFFK